MRTHYQYLYKWACQQSQWSTHRARCLPWQSQQALRSRTHHSKSACTTHPFKLQILHDGVRRSMRSDLGSPRGRACAICGTLHLVSHSPRPEHLASGGCLGNATLQNCRQLASAFCDSLKEPFSTAAMAALAMLAIFAVPSSAQLNRSDVLWNDPTFDRSSEAEALSRAKRAPSVARSDPTRLPSFTCSTVCRSQPVLAQ